LTFSAALTTATTALTAVALFHLSHKLFNGLFQLFFAEFAILVGIKRHGLTDKLGAIRNPTWAALTVAVSSATPMVPASVMSAVSIVASLSTSTAPVIASSTVSVSITSPMPVIRVFVSMPASLVSTVTWTAATPKTCGQRFDFGFVQCIVTIRIATFSYSLHPFRDLALLQLSVFVGIKTLDPRKKIRPTGST